MMKRICCAVLEMLVSLALFSCGDPLYIGTPYAGKGGDAEGPPPPLERKSLYVTGIEYPKGYNWLPELGSGSVEAVMFLMKDGERIVEIKVGTKYQVSADADMHRNIGDHLYTDYSTDEETIIKRDGVELFRYPDREMIYSMFVEGKDVYTLGSPRSGSGFTYRRNGEIVISKGSANIISGLYKDGEHIVFAYEDVIKSSESTRYKYYYVMDGESMAVAVPGDAVRVDDIRIMNGEIHYIASFTNQTYRIYYAGNESFELKRSNSLVIIECDLVYGGGKMFVKGRTGAESVFWYKTDMQAYSSSVIVPGWCADKENIYHLTSNSILWTGLTLKRNMTNVSLPSQYRFLYSGCIAAYDGECCIAAVNQGNGNSPVIWLDEAVMEYDFNGFFTSVSYQ